MIDEAWFQRLKKILELEEGNRRFVYDDATGKTVVGRVGNLSIGIGHNLQANGLSEAAREFIFREDVMHSVLEARDMFGVEEFESYPEPCRSAIVCLLFQMGYPRFSKFTDTISLIKRKDWSAVAENLERTLWANQLRVYGSKRLPRTLRMLRECSYDKDYGIDP